jgi:hypothetical protein
MYVMYVVMKFIKLSLEKIICQSLIVQVISVKPIEPEEKYSKIIKQVNLFQDKN